MLQEALLFAWHLPCLIWLLLQYTSIWSTADSRKEIAETLTFAETCNWQKFRSFRQDGDTIVGPYKSVLAKLKKSGQGGGWVRRNLVLWAIKKLWQKHLHLPLEKCVLPTNFVEIFSVCLTGPQEETANLLSAILQLSLRDANSFWSTVGSFIV